MESAGGEAAVRAGVAAGLFACLSYAALAAVELPLVPTVMLAAIFGPSLVIASVGLRGFLVLDRPRLSADLALPCNVVAGALATAMLLVQLAVKTRAGGAVPSEVTSIWLGLDVAWDVYIAIGTTLFAFAALGHPRVGWPLTVTGLAVGVLIAVLNLATFPAPPGDAGLFDAGPLVGLWYLAMTIQMWRSLGWVRARSRIVPV